MEPKNPIIINGVDVSECKYITYKNSLKPRCGNTCTPCRGRKNCYYKQLAHKERECQRAEQKLILIEDYCKGYCKTMCQGQTKETCESCIITQVMQIISEVN